MLGLKWRLCRNDRKICTVDEEVDKNCLRARPKKSGVV